MILKGILLAKNY